MPFHFCTDELLAILAMIPFIGLFFRRIHTWYHTKFHHKCHEKECNAEHVEHCHMPANIPHGKVGEGQCEQHHIETHDEEEGEFYLTTMGMVVGAILVHGPMTHEQIVALCPNEDPDDIHSTINELVEKGQLVLDGDLLKEGDLLK